MRKIIPLSQLLSFKNVYREDADWAALLAEFKSSPSDWHTIQLLCAELTKARFFREPIWVGCPDEHDENELWVYDGTHRTCAYLLVDAAEAEVEFEDDAERGWIEPEVFVETEIRALCIYEPPVESDREAGTVGLWPALLSLRIDDTTWLTSDASFTDGDMRQVTVAWDSLAPSLEPALINTRVREQLVQFGFDVDRLTIETKRHANADSP